MIPKHKHRGTAALAALLLLLVLPSTAPALGPLNDADLRERVLNAGDYPGEEVLILFEGHYFKEENGLIEERVQRLSKIISPWGLEQIGDPRLAFDGARQELTINACRSYRPDGFFTDSPANAFNEVTPGALQLAVDHLNIRDMVVSHTALEPGICIWLDYTLRDLAPTGLPFGRAIFPQGPFPVLDYELRLEGDIHAETINPPGALFHIADATRIDGWPLWTLSELPAQPGEAGYRLGDQLPWIAIGVQDGWEDLGRNIHDLILRSAEVHVGLEDWLESLEKDEPFLDDMEALRGWTEALGDRSALLRFRDAALLEPPRSVSRVLSSSYATTLERCALLTACCLSRDISVELLLPAPWRSLSRDVAPPGLLTERPLLILPSPHGGPDFSCFDPVSCRKIEAWELPDDGPLLRVGAEGARWLPDAEKTPLYWDLKLYWNLAEASAKAVGYLPFHSGLAGDAGRPESLLEDWVTGWTEGAELKELRITAADGRGLHFELRADLPLPEDDDRGYLRLDLPLPPLPLNLILPAGMRPAHSRNRALLFPEAPVSAHLSWLLDLPEGRPLIGGESGGAACPGGSFTLERTLSGERLVLNYDLDWDGRPVSPETYSECREFLNTALDPELTILLLGKSNSEEE